MKPIETIMRQGPVIAVLVVDSVERAAPIAEALVSGGIKVIEVTLRTECALEALREMKSVDGAIVGAGTVVDEASLEMACNAGADFVVSPGLTERLGRAAIAADIPFLPGVADAGDIMSGLELGLNHFKFFPAEASGGIAKLNALAAPFSQCRFCPTGGITAETAPDWLAIQSVLCVGGSWLGSGDPNTIRENARAVLKDTR